MPSTGRAAGCGEACSSPTSASDRGLPQRLRIPVARPAAALRGPGGAARDRWAGGQLFRPRIPKRAGSAPPLRPGGVVASGTVVRSSHRATLRLGHRVPPGLGRVRGGPGHGPGCRALRRSPRDAEGPAWIGSDRIPLGRLTSRAARGVPGKGRHVPRVAIQPHDAHRSLAREGLERPRPAGGRRCVRPRDLAPGPRRRDVSDAVFPRAGNGPRRSGGDPLPCAKKPRAASSTRLIGGLRSCGGRARSRSQTSMTGAASATSRRSRRRPNLVRPSPPRSPRRRCRCGSALSRTRRPPPKAGPDFKGPRFLAGKGTFRVCPIWEDG